MSTVFQRREYECFGSPAIRRYLFFVVVILSNNTLLMAQDKNGVSAQAIEQDSKYDIAHSLDFFAGLYLANHRGHQTTGFAPVNYDRKGFKDIEREYPEIKADPGGARDDYGLPFSADLKAFYTLQLTFPALSAPNPLMQDNNIKIKICANLTPVSFESGPYLEITPLAFLVLELGSIIGTGWDFDLFNVNGLAINDPNYRYEKGRTRLKRSTGAVSLSKMQVTLQFDTAAVMRSKNTNWSHVVFAVEEKIEYKHFTGADNDQYWRWEDDDGENQNGFVWHQMFFAGYQMPLKPMFLELVGILIETEQRITGKDKSKVKDGGWGSDFVFCEFGPFVEFQFSDSFGVGLLAQFKTGRQYTDETVGYRYFENRKIDTESSSYVYFSRLALIIDTTF